MRRQVVAHELAHGLPGFHGPGRVMRLKDDVLERQEALVDVRLVPEHIEACAFDDVALERVEQGCLIDGRSARDVDQDAVASQRLQDIGIDDPLGAGAPGQGHDEELGLLGQSEQMRARRYTADRLAG